MRRELAWIVGVVSASSVLAGCQLKDSNANMVNGKQLFVQECAACHTLQRAGATGVSGPNLDAAFAQSKKDGLGESTIEGVIYGQILHPNKNPQLNTQKKGETTPQMPANLVTGQDAKDVAAYVAFAASKSGEDEGKLAGVGASKAEGTATAENGVLDIPVAASGLAYKFADAEAEAGNVKFTSENPQPVDHDIAVTGNGVDAKGEIVTNGGVSEFSADLQPGEYVFFCSVPGHREGGMEGKLTVK
ncbi:c-type cytochrome [Solirubrobacter phytolaccae]|uniref:C-type cytochrome n=1 Tax=Solirubrobacter phytolaccae TaxID=1404360 RepID=A0A9X3S6G8_9ACTN|nr:c-type cytochrome [Solirubrobacter phytolaccae]MDA0179899.1 c-type cytochrome [Solirubrobacter phytolaccae]